MAKKKDIPKREEMLGDGLRSARGAVDKVDQLIGRGLELLNAIEPYLKNGISIKVGPMGSIDIKPGTPAK